MKKKFQLLLSLSIMVLVLSGTILFTLMVRQFITREMTKQIVMDNQIIGSEVINYLSTQIDTMDTDEMVAALQNICEEISLPNGGFICVMDEHGELLAAPNLEEMSVRNLMIKDFIDYESREEIEQIKLTEDNPLLGALNYANGMKTDIIASLPLSSSGLRLNVHQNMDSTLEGSKEFIRGFLCKKFPEVLAHRNQVDTDGMDMAICSIDKKSKKLSFSGANNPLLLVRGNEVIKYAGEKRSIGQHIENPENCFEQHVIDIQENDMLYLISDGMQDQFGGPHGKKFMISRLKEMLIKISKDKLEEQHQQIETTLVEWMGDLAQVDDITIMGIRVTKDLI